MVKNLVMIEYFEDSQLAASVIVLSAKVVGAERTVRGHVCHQRLKRRVLVHARNHANKHVARVEDRANA